MDQGRLFVVATPIGNLEDITARALRVLREVDLIASEDTRHSKRLLDHYGIQTPLTSYHEHNEIEKAETLVGRLKEGLKLALITDAGTPCISDPGYRLVRGARDQGIAVESVPGPSAAVAALSVSGLPSDRFAFHGFFPRKSGQVGDLMQRIRAFGGTHVFFESPHRVVKTLEQVGEHMPEAQVCLARELTKIHEQVVIDRPKELARRIESEGALRGECVLLVHVPADIPDETEWTSELLRARVEEEIEGGLSRRDAIRKVSAHLGLPRNVVYAAATEET